MHVLTNLSDIIFTQEKMPVCLTIGVFDGLHLGHRALIDNVLREAKEHYGTSVVFTFNEHPLCVLAPPHAPPRLISSRRRRELLEEMGIDWLIELPFTRDFAALHPREFIAEVLVNKCNLGYLTCGSNFRFGHEGKGDTTLLEEYTGQFDYRLEVVKELADDGTLASSTAIRNLVLSGEVEQANRLLQRPFELEGRVVKGEQRGRTIGFPTANLDIDSSFAVPARGVYACWAKIIESKDNSLTNDSYMAMVNIGNRPTFAGKGITIEANLLDFNNDIYNCTLSLAYVQRLRGEHKFDGINAIKEQLLKDEQHTRDTLKTQQAPW
jgi:riboflavin kinase/FMN adenylyltransferase